MPQFSMASVNRLKMSKKVAHPSIQYLWRNSIAAYRRNGWLAIVAIQSNGWRHYSSGGINPIVSMWPLGWYKWLNEINTMASSAMSKKYSIF
jgi:hypothetical protein